MNQTIFKWAVVGAGPAGIAAIGKLLDQGIEASHILWLDPHFNVGDLGLYWQNVSSNTTVELFNKFLMESPAFQYHNTAKNFKLNQLPGHDTCQLGLMVEPLQWITHHLRKKVNAQVAKIHHITLTHNTWRLEGDSKLYSAQNVILAMGAEPDILNYPTPNLIPFTVAIDESRLRDVVDINKTYAVFGSSHSAMIIIQNLVNLDVKKIINFYRSPCRYAINMGDWTLFDNTGLKGQTAMWARQHIDGTLPQNLTRYTATESHINTHLPTCDNVIYAVGFKRRPSLTIHDYEYNHYDPHIGILGPGLFGFGIAYPEIKADPMGCVETQVGLWKFMSYLNKVLPLWLKYPCTVSKST